MRYRKIAGVAAGALVAAGLGLGALSPAHAAPTNATAPVNDDCSLTYGQATLVGQYVPNLVISADGTAVTAPATTLGALYNAATAVSPAFKVETVTLTVNATVNGEAVTLTGTDTRAAGAGVSTAAPISLPTLTGTRAGTAAVTAAAVTGVSISATLWVPYGGPSGSSAAVTMSCSPAIDTQVTKAFTCSYQDFKIDYTALIKNRASDKFVRTEYVTPFHPGMPVFVTVSKFIATTNLKVAGAATAVTGTTSYSPAKPGNEDFIIPISYGSRSGTGNVATSDVTAENASFVLTAMGADNTINCVPAVAKVAPPVVVVAAATTSSTAVKYVKKKKTATITTSVNAGATPATGAVKIVVKVGKKQVASSAVALTSGKATLVLKKAKLKKKGKYSVTTTYAGNASFKASSSTKTFQVK
jgi:hypothetical protein